MQNLLKTVNRINDFAMRLEEDIRNKRLKPGDRYYTAAEAGHFLGTAVDTANKVLQVLEKKGVITRQKKKGTVISVPSYDRTDRRLNHHIHFLLNREALSVEGVGNTDILGGIQSVFPVASVNYSFLDREMSNIRNLLEDAYDKNRTDTFILVSVPYQVQQLFAMTDIPCVIFGTRYFIPRFIPSIEQDFHKVVLDAYKFFKENKRRKPAVLLKQTVLGGDAVLVNEILETFPGRPSVFFLPDDPEMIRSELASRFGDKMPDFVISSHSQFTLVAEELFKERSVSRKECDLVTVHPVLREKNTVKDSYFIDVLKPFELGELLGRTLLKILNGEKAEDIRLPMKFIKCEGKD